MLRLTPQNFNAVHSLVKVGSQCDVGTSVSIASIRMTLELIQVQLECYLTSISQYSTSQIPNIWHQELNLTGEKIHSPGTFAMLTLPAPLL